MAEQLPANIVELQRQFDNAMPSPRIGDTVNWFPAGDEKNPHAAIVTALEDPGRVAVTVFGRNQEPRYFVGVYHKSWEGHSPGSPDTAKRGTWDFIDGEVPKRAYERHKNQIAPKLRAAQDAYYASQKKDTKKETADAAK